MLAHHRISAGGSTPVVLIHGLGSAGTIWKPLISELPDVDLITIDLPGHGESAFDPRLAMDPSSLAEYVLDTLDSLNVERFHLVGNSLGGWTALELTAAHPERVVSVLALAPAGMREHPLLTRDPRLMRNRRMARALRPFYPILLRNRALRAIGFAHNSPVWQQWSYETCRDAAHAMADSPGYDAALDGTFGKVAACTLKIPATIPVRIIFGDTDNVLPASTSQHRAYLPRHATWEVWSTCGHAIQLDYPARVAEAVRLMLE